MPQNYLTSYVNAPLLNFYFQDFARQSILHPIRKPSPIGIFYQFCNFPMHSLVVKPELEVTSSCQLVITSLVNLYPSVSNIYLADTA